MPRLALLQRTHTLADRPILLPRLVAPRVDHTLMGCTCGRGQCVVPLRNPGTKLQRQDPVQAQGQPSVLLEQDSAAKAGQYCVARFLSLHFVKHCIYMI